MGQNLSKPVRNSEQPHEVPSGGLKIIDLPLRGRLDGADDDEDGDASYTPPTSTGSIYQARSSGYVLIPAGRRTTGARLQPRRGIQSDAAAQSLTQLDEGLDEVSDNEENESDSSSETETDYVRSSPPRIRPDPEVLDSQDNQENQKSEESEDTQDHSELGESQLEGYGRPAPTGDYSGPDEVERVRQENPYLAASKISRQHLSIEVFEKEGRFHSSLRGVDTQFWHMQAMQCLLTTHDKLLDPILDGNVQKARRADPELDGLLRSMYRRASDRQFSIYMFEFVDGDGNAPTPRELLHIADIAQRYMDTIGFEPDEGDMIMIEGIDTWKPKRARFDSDGARAGNRRYLVKDDHALELASFLENLRNFLAGEPQTEPLSRPLREIGFSIESAVRIGQHEKHWSSNYLMNLFEAIAGYLGWNYRNQASVIYLIYDPRQASIAEALWSCTAQVYTSTGRGFCHDLAGITVRSAYNDMSKEPEDPWQSQDTWASWAEYALEQSPFQANLEAEQARVATANEKAARLQMRIAELRQQQAQVQVPGDGVGDLLNETAEEQLDRLAAEGVLAENPEALELVRQWKLEKLGLWKTATADQRAILNVLDEMDQRAASSGEDPAPS